MNEHRVVFVPGYDRRKETPNYGQHPMHILFITRGSKGALVFNLNSGAYPERSQRNREPEVWGIDMHWHIEHDVHSDNISDSCDWLDGLPCIGERIHSSLSPAAETLFQTLILSGETPFWTALDKLYEELS